MYFYPHLGLYGIPLWKVMHGFSDHFHIPAFIERMCLHIEEVMLDEEGIFRKAGQVSEVERCRNLVNDGASVDLWKLESYVICDLLKLYLRELPEPLLTYELYVDSLLLLNSCFSLQSFYNFFS